MHHLQALVVRQTVEVLPRSHHPARVAVVQVAADGVGSDAIRAVIGRRGHRNVQLERVAICCVHHDGHRGQVRVVVDEAHARAGIGAVQLPVGLPGARRPVRLAVGAVGVLVAVGERRLAGAALRHEPRGAAKDLVARIRLECALAQHGHIPIRAAQREPFLVKCARERG